ncbi:MAG: proton-conducting transporter membrane subunit [Bacillota bacterium]
MTSPLLVLAVVIPVTGAVVIALLPSGDDTRRNCVAVLTTAVTAVLVVFLVQGALAGSQYSSPVLYITPLLPLVLRLDSLGALFALTASCLWVFATVYSTGYMAHEHDRRRYFTFFLLSLGATMGVAGAGNMLTLYLFYEMLTLATYPLVIHEGGEEAQRAGRKYMCFSLFGAGSVLGGLIISSAVFGDLEFAGSARVLDAAQAGLLTFAFLALFYGFGVKAAVMPLHPWLPSAMVAPTPVSALLHAVAVVKSGIFGIYRTTFSFYGAEVVSDLHVNAFMLFSAGVTILMGSVFALRQDNLKRRLAYSTVSQLGYIVLGAAILNRTGVTGGLLHLLNHALLKITLFFSAGAIITVTGKKNISEMSGLARRMPMTMTAFGLASLGMVGALPTNGFLSKWYLIEGGLLRDAFWIPLLLVTSAVLNAAYFFPIVTRAFFFKGDFGRFAGHEAPPSMLYPILILCGLFMLLGLWPRPTLAVADVVASALFGGVR